jgi:hypothetical protein
MSVSELVCQGSVDGERNIKENLKRIFPRIILTVPLEGTNNLIGRENNSGFFDY